MHEAELNKKHKIIEISAKHLSDTANKCQMSYDNPILAVYFLCQ